MLSKSMTSQRADVGTSKWRRRHHCSIFAFFQSCQACSHGKSGLFGIAEGLVTNMAQIIFSLVSLQVKLHSLLPFCSIKTATFVTLMKEKEGADR